LGAIGAVALGGCERLSRSEWFSKGARRGRGRERDGCACGHVAALDGAGVHRSRPLADVPQQRHRGARHGRLSRDGGQRLRQLPARRRRPRRSSGEPLAHRPARAADRTQITRHDCVEGWSAIAKWKGARLAALLESVRLKPDARFAVFYCADPMAEDGTDFYYESIDLEDAFHPQTILAYEMNDAALPVANGAPIRLRVERQLGYKHAKYVMRIELVSSFAHIAGGRGGYWEDLGYQWFAGNLSASRW
jgi:hypothetical protein